MFVPDSFTMFPVGGAPFPDGDLLRWFNAGDLGLSDGDSVGQWDDLSANADHATQATAANKPTFKTGIINGEPVVRFATDDFLSFSQIFNTSGAVGAMFVVAELTSGTSGNFLSTRSASPDPNGGWGLRGSNTTSALYFHVGGTPNLTFSYASGFHLLEVIRDGLDVDTYVDGSLDDSQTTSSYTASPAGETRIGGSPHNGGSSFLNGDIAEIIILDAMPSASDRGDIESYLMTKYGL